MGIPLPLCYIQHIYVILQQIHVKCNILNLLNRTYVCYNTTYIYHIQHSEYDKYNILMLYTP